MFNPLLQDLSLLKNEDIDNKINELMRKYSIAARSGQGMVCEQISVIIDAYRSEQQMRYVKTTKQFANQNKNLDDYINVN